MKLWFGLSVSAVMLACYRGARRGRVQSLDVMDELDVGGDVFMFVFLSCLVWYSK